MENESNKKQNYNKKNQYLTNRPIDSINDDIIGIQAYIDAINSSIDNGDKIISLSSNFGGGKSSIINILKNQNKFNKISIISLYDLKNMNEQKDDLNIRDFNEAFLYKLANDYKGLRYASYISKVFNKSINRFSFCINKFSYFLLLILSIILFMLGLFFYHINDYLAEELINILLKNYNKIFSYISMFAAALLLLITIYRSKILFTYWNSKSNLSLSNEEIITLYTELIDDSIHSYEKPNVIIIEDVDRCIDENNNIEVILRFIRLINTLSHHTCKQSRISRKLDKIHFIICIDESKINTETNNVNNDEILKLFDRSIHLGEIYDLGYSKILFKLTNKIGLDEYISDLNILLKSKNVSLRLLKNELNDIKLKKEVLENKFDDSHFINFKSCIAYSYLKNNYDKEIYDDKHINYELIQEYIKEKKINKNYNNIILGNTFQDDLKYLVYNDYLDDEFSEYLYNCSKHDNFRNNDQQQYWLFINKRKLYENVTKNIDLIEDEYILNCDAKMNEYQLSYPVEIFKNDKLCDLLISSDNINESIKRSLEESKEIYSKESFDFLLEIIKILTRCDNKTFKLYFEPIYKNMNKSIEFFDYSKELFYEVRQILISNFNDEMYNYSELFEKAFDSIHYNELAYVKHYDNISSLINLNRFNSDLEKVIFDVKECLNEDLLIHYCKVWSKNVFNNDKFFDFLIYTLNHSNFYDLNLISLLKQYRDKTIDDINKLSIDKITNKYDNTTLNYIDELLLYNFFDVNSQNHLMNYQLFKTFIVKNLKDKKYENLLDYRYRNNMIYLIENEFEFINDEIISFKQYILYNHTDHYLFLFDDKYDKLFDVNYDVNLIQNKYLLQSKIKSLNDLKQYIFVNKNDINTDTFSYIINQYNNYVERINNDLISFIFENIPNYIIDSQKNNDDTFQKIILGLPIGEHKSSFIIKFQMLTNSFVSNSVEIRECKDNDLLSKFAEYLDNISIDKLDISQVVNCLISFKYNEHIISKLKENGYYSKALICSNKIIKDIIKYLSINDIHEIYLHNRLDLFINNLILERIRSINAMKTFNYNEIYNIHNEFKTSEKLLGKFFDLLNESDLKKLIKEFDYTNPKLLVHGIKYSNLAIRILVNDSSLEKYVYERLGTYNRALTKILKKFK